jgi:hypothetical protein
VNIILLTRRCPEVFFHYSINPILLKINYRVPFRGVSKPDTTVPGSLIIVQLEVFEGGKSVVRRLTIATAITCV